VSNITESEMKQKNRHNLPHEWHH